VFVHMLDVHSHGPNVGEDTSSCPGCAAQVVPRGDRE